MGSSLGPTSVTRLSSDAWEILSQMALLCLGNLEFAVRKASQATNEAFVPLCAQSEKLKEMLSSPMLP